MGVGLHLLGYLKNTPTCTVCQMKNSGITPHDTCCMISRPSKEGQWDMSILSGTEEELRIAQSDGDTVTTQGCIRLQQC